MVDKDVNLLGAGPGPRPDPTQKPSDFPVFSGGRAGTNPAAAGSIATIIKAPTGKRVLEVKATRTIGVTGFLLFGGDIGGSYPNNFTFGGTIFNAGTLTLADCIVINGKAYVGGNIANGGTLVIDNSAVVGGKTSGGIYSFAGGIYTGDGSTLRLLAQSSAVSGSYSAWIVWANSATGVGGIYADGATVSMKDEGWLSYNSSSGVGGLFAGSNVTAGTLTIGGCSSDTGGNVCTNKVVHVANNDAGGINVQQGTTLTIQGATEISGNSNTVRGGDGGGGVMIFGNATIKGNAKITGNSTAGSGGNYGGGIAISSPGTLDLKDNVEVSGNTADIGGGLYVGQGVASLSIGSNVRIKNNSARGTGNAGGGVSVYDDTSPATFGASATNVTGNTNANGTCPNYAQNNGATCATLV